MLGWLTKAQYIETTLATQGQQSTWGTAIASRSEPSAHFTCFMRAQGHPGLTGGSMWNKCFSFFAVDLAVRLF